MTHPANGAPNAGVPGPNPYDPGPPWTSPSPPQTTKVSAGRIAVIAGVAVVVLVGSPLAFLAGRASAAGGPATSAAPTTASATRATTATKATTAATAAKASASPTTETVCGSGSITGAVWSAKVPAGWQCSGRQALGLSLTSSTNDTITLLVTPAPDDSACDSALSILPKLVTLPDVAWGGQTAIAAERDLSGKVLSYRCTIRDGRTYLMTATPITGASDSVRTAIDAVVASWTWK